MRQDELAGKTEGINERMGKEAFRRHCSETTHLIPDEQTRSRLGKQQSHSMIKGKQWKANSCNFFGASLLSLVLDFLTIAHRMGPDSLPACALASLPAFSLPAYITRSTWGLRRSLMLAATRMAFPQTRTSGHRRRLVDALTAPKANDFSMNARHAEVISQRSPNTDGVSSTTAQQHHRSIDE